jgi:hypothetical protein
MYDHTSAVRKHAFPAGPDAYREFNYDRDDDHATFRIRKAPSEEMVTV